MHTAVMSFHLSRPPSQIPGSPDLSDLHELLDLSYLPKLSTLPDIPDLFNLSYLPDLLALPDSDWLLFLQGWL